MAKAENKTQKTAASVQEFLDSVDHEQRKADSFLVLKWMQEITGLEPRMWGPSLVGFGNYHYKYETGREGDIFKVGFSPRKQALTLYIMPGFERYDSLMAQLGKYKTGKACLYINKLDDVDHEVLRELITLAFRYMTEKYG